MRVLVCGGRNYTDQKHVWQTLFQIDAWREFVGCVIHGGATGADSHAASWAKEMTKAGNVVAEDRFDADWNLHGRKAGPIRNARMLAEGKPDLVVAFPGGRGTSDMVSKAKAAGVEVIEIPARPAPSSPMKRTGDA